MRKRMKKSIFLLIISLFMPFLSWGQTSYSALWKKASEAESKDLPQSQYKVLQQIVEKATKEKVYGQLLKAELNACQVMQSIAPDSIRPAVDRIQQRCDATTDPVLKTVYQTVLWRVWLQNPRLSEADEEGEVREKPDKPVLTPELCEQLAQVKDESYEPFVVQGVDSKVFGHDLLSIVGQELGDYQALHDYYEKVGNRSAACLMALEVVKPSEGEDKKAQVERLDSLLELYGDLSEAGEVAIERYQVMDRKNDTFTTEEKINFIHQALDKWGSWKRSNILKNYEAALTRPGYTVGGDGKVINYRIVTPMKAQQLPLRNLRNINGLNLKVYAVKAKGDIDINPDYEYGYKKIKPLLGKVVYETSRQFSAHQPYEQFEDSLTIEGLPAGVYMLEFSTTPNTVVVRRLYFVTDIFVMEESQPDGSTRFVVVKATTGQPIAKATVRVRENPGLATEKTHLLTTDAKGQCFYSGNGRRTEVFAYTDTDQACPEQSNYMRYSYNDNGQRESREYVIFTDRAIYRPGQTVHASAIVYDVFNGYEHKATIGQKVTLALRDANGKMVKEQRLITDQYGVCAADFTLPSSGLTGQYTLQLGNRGHNFRVEEYKRPTFEVKFDPYKEDYKDGDTVTVKATAKSYAGVPVQEAKVQYRVVRRRAYWWISYWRYWDGGYIGTGSEDVEITKGETITEPDGTFKVDVPMTLPKTDYPMFYNFIVTADVTDGAGETHAGEYSLPLGNRKTALSVDLEEQVLLEKSPMMTFHLRNAAGQDIDAQVRYKLDDGKWQDVKTQTKIDLTSKKLKSGMHHVEAVCGEDTLKYEFTVFSLDDKVPAKETNDWYFISDIRFPNDGTPVTLQVGSSAKDVYIAYSIFSGKTVVEQGFVNQSNALINRKLKYKEEWGDGILCTFAWVKNGKCYNHQQTISRPLPDKTLKLQWTTFRDRLTPGQQEEWTLTVTKDGKPVDAMVMATLYDKSLDQLTRHNWSFYPRTFQWLPSTNWQFTPNWVLSATGSTSLKNYGYSELRYSHFDHDIYPTPWYSSRRMLYGTRARGSAKMDAGMVMEEAAPMMATVNASIGSFDVDESLQGRVAELDVVAKKRVVGNGLPSPESAKETEPLQMDQVQIRENLNETAFFYPQLTTDSTGAVALKFTLPESLTTWRFMGLAHTQDMCYGLLNGEAVAKKDLMIQPNMPRFIREGDQAVIAAKIFNTGEKALKGKAMLRLKDPMTEQVVFEQQQDFAVEVDGTTSVSFALDMAKVASGTSLLVCQAIASCDGFSDGEQHYLPILPATERVTVTRPFTQIEPGTKTIDLTTLFPGADKKPVTNKKLTIEYTNNPAWLMIQALPAIGKPRDDDAISQMASYYANSIGKYIVDQNPKVKTVFKLWQEEKSDETSLMSALEKDQELKNLILNETPWVMDADRETEQKERLVDFFDDNLMQNRLNSAFGKLEALQKGDGSWSWWPGMPGSFYITVEVSEMLVRQNALIGTNQQTKNMLSKAFKFMGYEIIELVKEMKKMEKKGIKPSFPSFKALQWLYLCALDGRTLPDNVQKANDYLIPLLRKEIKSQTLYEKAMTAVIWSKLPNLQPKDRQKAQEYVQSLKEFTVYREEMGRYYDTPRAGYSWYDYKIPTQTMAVEAMQQITPDDKQTIQEMQRWLLQEKRTQAWDTPINSVNAVYAFLNGSKVLSDLTSPLSVMKVDATVLDNSKATAGLGYIKTVVEPESKTFTVEKTSEGTSWGAVYAQFNQQTREIENSSSGIKVIREILSPQKTFAVGDRVKVRLTIIADRDLDFVQVLDKRAACMEPVNQLSGYRNGVYITPRDNSTNYYFDIFRKGRWVVETEYYIDRPGTYETGTCTVQCAYAPEFKGTTHSLTLEVKSE